MASPEGDRGALLLLDAYFDEEDRRFLDQLRAVRAAPALAAFADRWKRDPRPWARRQILDYLDLPLDRPGHHPVVKRLFKHAEGSNDDELMAAFLVAFDRLVRREVRTRWRFDADARTPFQEEFLRTPRNAIVAAGSRTARDPRTGKPLEVPRRAGPGARLFSYHTRYYLRRRAWRYFRRLGFRRPAEFPAAIARALARYRDEDLARGEHLLDSWGLMQACFRRHEALRFTTNHVALRDGRGLGELSPAPRFPEAWRAPEAAELLLRLVAEARSRVVRVWSIQMLRRDHRDRLAGASPAALVRLLDHDDPEVQQFGAELFASASGLDAMPIPDWLRLLKTQNLTVLATLCEVMARHVTPERLDLAACVELACAEPAPVARLGLSFLKSRAIATAADRAALAVAADAACAAAARELAAWALEVVGAPESYDRDLVIRFFDSASAEVRAAAWAWLAPAPPAADSPGAADPVLWARLLETPHDDVRLRLVDFLESRARGGGGARRGAGLPGGGNLIPLWASVLLNVHRGGRQKLKALHQVARALQADPARSEALLPLLAVALRSVRAPEAHAGLAAVVAAVEARPELEDAVRRHLPELDLHPAEAAP
jgi:hypothetical protein